MFGEVDGAGHAAAGRGRRRRAGDRVGAAPGLPRPPPRRGADPRDLHARAGHDPRPRRLARWPTARTGCPTSTPRPPRSPAGSARRRPSAPTSWPRAACRRTRRSASAGSSASSTPSWPARPAASCGPARGCWRASRRSAARASAPRSIPTSSARRCAALAGRYGGIAAVRPRTGEVLALAGVAFSAPQPPGSVFKIVTLTAALEARTVRRNESFPVQTAATLEGIELENANGESCGGSLINSFAHSCNSVFAPMGAELGADKLVAAAERFGFNEDPGLAGRRPLDDPGGGRDRRRPGRRLDRDRPGQGAHDPAADGADRRRDRRGRPPHAADAAPRRDDRGQRGDAARRRPLRRPRDARGGDERHRRRRPAAAA